MILVIGAGPAGLLAAWHAARRGLEVTVVERSAVVGGLAGSFEVAGQRVDWGSHRLHPSIDPALLGELRGLLDGDLQVRPRHGRIVLAGRHVAFPLRSGDLLRRLPPTLAARMALDALTGPLRRPRDDTYAEVVRAGLGPTVERSFYGPYARKLWGVEGSALAGEVARRRIAAASPGAVLARLVRTADPARRTFLYPRLGFGQLSEALADAAASAGAAVRLGVGVTALRPGVRGLHATLDDGSTVDAAQVWSTAPLATLPEVVDGAPPAILAAAQQLEHRAMVLLYLVHDAPSWSPFDAHYFPEPSVLASRCSEPKRYRASDADPRDRTVLCLELPCTRGDEVWSSSADELASRLVEELGRAGLPPVRLAAAELRRVPRLYPVYRPGFAAPLEALEAWVHSVPGLVTLGRQGLHVADNTHHVLAMGRDLAAACTDDGGLDQRAWAASRALFRAFVVED